MSRTPPKITNAPGITWHKRKGGQWKAIWRARTDLIERGYAYKSVGLWVGTPDELDGNNVYWIQTRANDLQADMLQWSRGEAPRAAGLYNGTIEAVAYAYRNDPDSPYHKKRYVTRQHYDKLVERIVRDHGNEIIAEMKGRMVKRWHDEWTADGKIALGHALVGMLRTIINFGSSMLDDEDCARLSAKMSDMRFSLPKPRSSVLTAEMAEAFRAKAHEMNYPSMALAQAFQFELMLRQKDVIGEWVPISEPGISDVTHKGQKWLRGLRWEEIDENLILRHVTSKRGKEVEHNLLNAPMVMEELALLGGRRLSGPVIVGEKRGRPWNSKYFCHAWREIATAAGIPKSVRNMDSRAGAITEATDAGADLEHIRHAATHSDIKMTQRYSRGATDKSAGVMKLRVEHRNKKGTGTP
jgi:hypothetical protein